MLTGLLATGIGAWLLWATAQRKRKAARANIARGAYQRWETDGGKLSAATMAGTSISPSTATATPSTTKD